MHPDVAALPIVRAYIDETGDRGFTAKSSPYFGFGAVLVPDEVDMTLRAAVQQMRTDFQIAPGGTLHWVEHLRARQHTRRKYAARLLAGQCIRPKTTEHGRPSSNWPRSETHGSTMPGTQPQRSFSNCGCRCPQ